MGGGHMDYGMPFLLETLSPEKCVALCKKLDLQFIEWNMNFPQCQIDQFDIEWLNRVRKEQNIYYTLHLDEAFNICDFNSNVRKAYLKTVQEAIAFAKQVEIPIINMHLAKGIFITLPDKKEYLFKMFQAQYFDCLKEFRELCTKLIGSEKIMISIENTVGFAPHEQDAVELLLESACFGLTLDIGHSHAAGNVDIPFYDLHMDRLIHMHAHDAKGTKNHLAFGDGEIDLQQRLRIANARNARVVLETKTIEALTKTVHYKGELII